MPEASIIIYTDGSCSPNPGPGGYAAVIRLDNGPDIELTGREDATTNNRMELMAPIAALEWLTAGSTAYIYTDSQYVRTGITAWLAVWKTKGWRTAAGKPVKNIDLWKRLDAATARHTIHWRWIKGHAGHPGNERADELARRAVEPSNGMNQ